MENKKFQLLSVVFAAFMLAACSSTDVEEGGDVDSGQSLSGFEGSSGSARETQPTTEVEEPAEELQSVFYFDFDSSTLSAEARNALDAQIARLKDSVGTIRLEGHTDERGTREYNIALGERRAQAVADYMALNGISRFRIETVSYGEERPVAFGQGDSAWSQNRRVELK